jgi:uncharacterized protein (DUF2141 family)
MPPVPTTAHSDTGTVTVVVENLRNASGNLIICLYRSGPFIDRKNIAFVREIACTGGKMTVPFYGVPHREYAVFAFHDEDRNRSPDPGPDGEPAEGMALSNVNVETRDDFEFDRAKFTFDRKSMELNLSIRYWVDGR